MRLSGKAILLAVAVFLAVAGQFFLAAPILENPDGYGHYLYVRTLARTGHFPALDALGDAAGGEAGQAPLYYLLAAAVLKPFPDTDLDQVAIPNPHGPRRAGDNPNVLFHRPFSGWPHGAELAVRVVEALSVLCSAITVVCTVLLARLAFPKRPLLWAASGIALAGNAAFAYLSTGVTNDVLVTALSSAAVLAIAHWLVRKPPWGAWASAALIAFAVLAKFNAIVLLVPFGCVLSMVERTALRRLTGLGQALAALLLVDGWWWARNAVLYGDPTGMIAINRQFFGSGYQPLSGSLADKLHSVQLFSLFRSFFAMFGRYVLAADWAYAWEASLTAVGLIAGVVVMLRVRRNLALLLTGWIALTILETLAYGAISVNGGRFIYPAIAPMAVLVVAGWAWLLRVLGASLRSAAEAGPNYLPWAGSVLLAAGVAVSSACSWLVVKPAYAYPPVLKDLPASARALQARFDGSVELAGVDGPAEQEVRPGAPLDLTLYWRLRAPEARPLSEFVHVQSNDPAYDPHTGYEGAPGAGAYPPNFWQPGEIVVDHHSLTLAPDTRSDRRNAVLLTVRAGMYYLPPLIKAAITPVSADPPLAAAGGLPVAVWKLPRAASPTAAAPLASWDRELQLMQASARAEGPVLTASLAWRTPARPAHDYTVFLQLLDRDGKVVAQHDSQPLEGRYPTTAWSAGEQVFDDIRLNLSRSVQVGDSLIAGVYVLPSSAPIPDQAGEPYVRIPLGDVNGA